MSSIKSTRVQCPDCGTSQNASIYLSVRAADLQLKTRLMDGDLFRFSCNSCGGSAKLSYPVLYVDNSHKFAVWYSAEAEGTEKLQDAMDEFGFLTRDYKLRFVTDSNRLIETIAIFDAHLNDFAVYLAKLSIQYDAGIEPEDLYFSKVANTSGGCKLTFVIPSTQQSVSTVLQHLEQAVEEWNQFDDELDWVNVNGDTFFKLLPQYKARFS